VIPFAAGGGVPLFAPDARPGRLRLAGSTSWASGILELDHRPVLSGAGPSGAGPCGGQVARYPTRATPTSDWPARGGSGSVSDSAGCQTLASTTPGSTSGSGPKKLVNSATEWL
jgi:hypothetical protein